jgi:BirA family biotin operon repressor/biotin-[acetyl-CoA-carboxylase] ligase
MSVLSNEPMMSRRPDASEYLTEAQIQEGLNTTWVGRKILSFGIVKSTNEYAFRLAEDGASEGTVVVADEQSAGRGRFGRRWHSPPGLGLWFSIILRPTLFPWETPMVTMVAALATAHAIHKATDLTASLKWPNDVLIGQRKVCGILTELNAEIDSVNFVVVGIGLNVNQREWDFPQDIRERATSLCLEKNRRLSRINMLQHLLHEFELAYDRMIHCGFSDLRDEIKSLSCLLERTVAVRLKNRIYKGRVVDIDEQGGLVLRVGKDRIEHIISGEVQLIEE